MNFQRPIQALVFALLLLGCSAPEASLPPSPEPPSKPPTDGPPSTLEPTATPRSPDPGPTIAPLSAPTARYVGQRRIRQGENRLTAYDLAIDNWADYPAELFSGGEHSTCVVILSSATNAELSASCDLATPEHLMELSFELPRIESPPPAVYVEIRDDLRQRVARSLSVAIPSEVAANTPQPTPQSRPTPDPNVWTGPQQISSNDYEQLALAVDAQGIAHAAAVRNDAIFYLTNQSGSWTRERLTTAVRTRRTIEVDDSPTIALDTDGSVWIAWVHRSGSREDPFGPFPEAIQYSTNRTGSWSAPAAIVKGFGNSPTLQVRNGHIHLAYQDGFAVDVLESSSRFPIRYSTNAGGSWTDERVVNHGTNPQLRLASDGTARILFGDEYGLLRRVTELRYAVGATSTGSFNVEQVSGSIDEDSFYAFDLDRADKPTLLWGVADEDLVGAAVRLQRRDGGQWSAPQSLVNFDDFTHQARPGAMAVDSEGNAHVLVNEFTYGYVEDQDDWIYEAHGIRYATNRGGSILEQLVPDGRSSWSQAMAVDQAGRAHILIGIEEGAKSLGLWYAVGPIR